MLTGLDGAEDQITGHVAGNLSVGDTRGALLAAHPARMPTTQRNGVGTLTYSPLSGGWLSGRLGKDIAGRPTSSARPSVRFDLSMAAQQRKLDIVEQLALLADAYGHSLVELTIAFVVNHPVSPRPSSARASWTNSSRGCRPSTSR